MTALRDPTTTTQVKEQLKDVTEDERETIGHLRLKGRNGLMDVGP